jgi:hypothetical protein
MTSVRLRLGLVFVGASALLVSCGSEGSSDGSDDGPSSQSSASSTGSGGAGAAGGGGAGGAPVDPTALCTELDLPVRAFEPGPYGIHRGEVADDFTVPLQAGGEFRLADHWSGCESYLFVPDRIPVSALDETSIWDDEDDLADLLAASPRNTQWFFVSRTANEADAAAILAAMQVRLDGVLAGMAPADAEHWRANAHVVGTHAQALESWIGEAMLSHGLVGFGIDRRQRVRGMGMLADVTRFKSALQNAGEWPWEQNLAYAANEALYFEAQEAQATALESDGAEVVELFGGEVLEEFADTTATLPSAAEMAGFDTLQVEVEMQCPDPELPELGNCGAWDYLANLYVQGEGEEWVQLARFITTYHRAAHWVVDVSPMLVHLAAGGARSFRWSFAPEWNKQPTATRLSLRLSKQNKPERPTSATLLWTGGAFGSGYDALHPPVEVPIPATAKKVELWAIITGHEAGTQQCAEFCNHVHEVTVNGKAYTKDHPEAASDDGCVPEIAHGMTPNQGGTWWFGRGGWCPGEQVTPWVVDVTADVVPGETATLSYLGKLGNASPPDGAGTIDMVSYLVVHE